MGQFGSRFWAQTTEICMATKEVFEVKTDGVQSLLLCSLCPVLFPGLLAQVDSYIFLLNGVEIFFGEKRKKRTEMTAIRFYGAPAVFAGS